MMGRLVDLWVWCHDIRWPVSVGEPIACEICGEMFDIG